MKHAVCPSALPRLHMLDAAQCEQIHAAALEVLRRTGVRVHQDEALRLLKDAGAYVCDTNLVKIPAALVEWALQQAPSYIGLCARGSDQVVASLAGRNVSFGPGSDCPNYLDPRTGQKRRFTTQDVIDCIRLVDALPQLSFVMSMGIPSDIPARETGGARPNTYRHQFALMLEHTVKPIVFVCDDRADCEAITAMAAAAAGGLERLQINPTLLLYSEPTSPLQHSRTATEKLLFMAEHRLPVVHSPAPMMGGTAPASLAGGLVLGTAEVLSSLVIHQLKHAGAPFVFGSGLHHMDMKTTISVYGAPEFQLARIAVAEMGRYYGLPTWGYAGHSDSNVMDEQAAADAAMSVLVALLTGTNLVHDVGYLEAGLTTSPEMIVFTAEMIDFGRQMLQGIPLDAEAMALEVIHRVGPGGDYLSDAHTLEHFRAFWQPALFDRRRAEAWQAAGSKRLGERLRDRTLSLMESHRPQPLPDAVKAEIQHILADR
ncbi:MAG: trimethylamine methyltransferase family protein [Anaerolineae bacterium]|nr:trimethylamine methyltransferase family protein [Anaerolineae bacterium]MDW8070316.1 trimethylamine methyltransferase family protein [Anaerolineae bacterium]